jgi:hypothetical protein
MQAAVAGGGAAAALMSFAVTCADDELGCAADECLALLLESALKAIDAAGIFDGEDDRRRLRTAIEDYIGVPEPLGLVEQERCRICGCGELSACIAIRGPEGRTRNCSWADDSHTLCDNPDCLAKAGLDQARVGEDEPGNNIPLEATS